MFKYSIFLSFVLILAASANALAGSITLQDSAQIITDSDSLLVCNNTSIELASTPADSFSWMPAADFDDASAQVVQLTPSQPQWYFLTAYVNGVACVDSVFITLFDPSFQVSVSRTDTICPKDPVGVVFTANAPLESISWDPADGVEDPENIDSTVVRPLETTEYIVTAVLGNCEVSDTFTIDVIPFTMRLLTGDTMYLCKPDEGTIRFNVSPPGVNIVWSPDDEFIEPQGNTAIVSNTISATYNATAMHMGCTLSQDIFVRVDSLPPLDLTHLPVKDPYCAGEEIYIIGANVDTSLYPDLEWQWIPDDGQIQDSTNTGNVHVVLLDTTTFVRYANNNACSDSSDLTVNVIPPAIPLSVTDTTLCPGETFVVEVLDPNIQNLEWMPTEGLSCSTCPNPTVTVLEMEQMYTVSGENEGCPVSGTLTVRPKPDYPIPVAPNPIVGCVGDQIQVMIDTSGGVTNLNIGFANGTGGLSCTDCPDPVVTIQTDGLLVITGDQLNPDYCDAFASIPVQIGQLEQVNGGLFTGCVGDPITIDLSGFGFVNPMLSITGDASLSCSTCLMPEVTLNSNSNANLVVTSDDSSPGFCGKVTTFVVTPATMDVATFELSDSFPGQGEIITVTLNTNPPPPAGTPITWTVNGRPISGTGLSVEVSLDDPGVNTIVATWINSSGCPQSASVDVNAREPEINIPNAFTPNNDMYNDKFRIDIVGNIQLTEFLIFNRWGKVVYDNPDPEGWDGNFSGEPAPPEVYVYMAKFTFPNGNTEIKKGDVTLIR